MDFSDALPKSKMLNMEAVGKLRDIMGYLDMTDAGRVKPAVHLARAPKTERGEYVIFYGHTQMGLTFPLSAFFKAILDFYGIKVNDLTPNSILMLSTFVYLCEAFVGVAPTVTLWRHFFVLRALKGRARVFGGFSFQRRKNPRTPYILCDFDGKWEDWRSQWAYVMLREREPRMEVPDGATDYDIEESNMEPDMDAPAWAPVLERIEELADAWLHMTSLLSGFIWRRLAPLRENPKRF